MTCNIDYIVFLELPFMRSEIVEIILQVLLVGFAGDVVFAGHVKRMDWKRAVWQW